MSDVQDQEAEKLHEEHTGLHGEHEGLHGEHEGLVKGQSSFRGIFVGSTVVLWLLTMFVIASLNKVNKQLGELKRDMNMMTNTVMNLPYCEVQDADGNVVYRLNVPDATGEEEAGPGMEVEAGIQAEPVAE